MTNQKSLDKKKTSELFEGVNSSLHQAFVEAVERDKEPKKISACCNAEVVTANSGLVGETNYYICTKCHNDCDVIAEPKELDWVKKLSYMEDETNTLFEYIKRKIGDDAWKMMKNIFIGEIKNTLTQQRTELLEEIKKEIDKETLISGIAKSTFLRRNWIDIEGLKQYINLLNKKDEKK